MPKLPDLSKLTEKIDLQNIMNSVKSIIHPEPNIPPGMENDPLGAKVLMINEIAKNLASLHKQQEEEYNKIMAIIQSLYKDIDALKQTAGIKTSPSESSKTPGSENDKKE